MHFRPHHEKIHNYHGNTNNIRLGTEMSRHTEQLVAGFGFNVLVNV
jgi:hypothetical protein